MKRNQIISFVFLSVLLAACATPKVDLSTIKLITEKDAETCQGLAKVRSENLWGDVLAAENDMKELVVESKGDSYIIDETIQNGSKVKLHGRAFRCKMSAK